MGLRAYLLIKVQDDVRQEDYVQALLEMEAMQEADFVDPVLGDYDISVMIEAPVSVEAVARKVEEKEWAKEVKVLKIVSIFERHKGSKRELLQALRRDGV